MLIINADDWGGWKAATDAALACYKAGRITSVSAMVFMEDSERAATLARENGIDAGLHINFTLPFSDPGCPPTLSKEQDRLRRFLKCNKYAQLLYNPFLRKEFRSVYQAQAQEFRRLYGRPPSHTDGHQHMHLCTNMLIDKVIPAGERVRRSFSFWPGEKSGLNRAYRARVDTCLGHRHRILDYFFSLEQCVRHNRLERVVKLCLGSRVELMTHPERRDDYATLASGSFGSLLKGLPMGSYASV